MTPKLNTVAVNSDSSNSSAPTEFNDIETLAAKWNIETSVDSETVALR